MPYEDFYKINKMSSKEKNEYFKDDLSKLNLNTNNPYGQGNVQKDTNDYSIYKSEIPDVSSLKDMTNEFLNIINKYSSYWTKEKEIIEGYLSSHNNSNIDIASKTTNYYTSFIKYAKDSNGSDIKTNHIFTQNAKKGYVNICGYRTHIADLGNFLLGFSAQRGGIKLIALKVGSFIVQAGISAFNYKDLTTFLNSISDEISHDNPLYNYGYDMGESNQGFISKDILEKYISKF